MVKNPYNPLTEPASYRFFEDKKKEPLSEKDDRLSLKDLVNDLLLFTETDGTVCNGFRTKEIMLKLKAICTKQ